MFKIEVTLHAHNSSGRETAVRVLGQKVSADLNGHDRVRMTSDQWARLTLARRKDGTTGSLTWDNAVVLEEKQGPLVIDVSA